MLWTSFSKNVNCCTFSRALGIVYQWYTFVCFTQLILKFDAINNTYKYQYFAALIYDSSFLPECTSSKMSRLCFNFTSKSLIYEQLNRKNNIVKKLKNWFVIASVAGCNFQLIECIVSYTCIIGVFNGYCEYFIFTYGKGNCMCYIIANCIKKVGFDEKVLFFNIDTSLNIYVTY